MASWNWRIALLVSVAGTALSGCLPEEVSQRGNNPPVGPGQVNSAPVISGNPPLQATVGTAYLFQALGSDNDGDALTFSASGLPSWASLNPQTGVVHGTPGSTHVGIAGPVVIRVSDGEASASLPAFHIAVSAATLPPANKPPTISGSPVTSISAGTPFNFTPTANDPEGGPLAFSISLDGVAGAKPGWATFNTTTGQLTGTAQPGTYNIIISVTDAGAASAHLAFALTVATSAATGMAALSWIAPTQNTDGSSLTDLAGYRIYHGLSATALSDVIELEGAGTTSHTFTGLGSGTHYFAVAAYNSAGAQSAPSTMGSKFIP